MRGIKVIKMAIPVIKMALVVIILAGLVISAEACNHCGYSACGGCKKAASYGYETVLRQDGTYWRGGVEVERLRVLRRGEWTWDFFPKASASASATANAYAYAGPANAQGTTIYGTNKLTESYGQPSVSVFAQGYQPDPNLALKLLSNAIDGAQNLANEGIGGVKALGDRGIEVSKINAARDATVAMIQAASVKGPETVEREFTFRAQVGSDGSIQVKPEDTAGRVQAFGSLSARSVLENRCVACHAGADAKGGLDLTADLTPEDYRSLLPRLMADHPGKPRMPLGKDGKAGQALSAQEFAAIWEASQGPGPSN